MAVQSGITFQANTMTVHIYNYMEPEHKPDGQHHPGITHPEGREHRENDRNDHPDAGAERSREGAAGTGAERSREGAGAGRANGGGGGPSAGGGAGGNATAAPATRTMNCEAPDSDSDFDILSDDGTEFGSVTDVDGFDHEDSDLQFSNPPVSAPTPPADTQKKNLSGLAEEAHYNDFTISEQIRFVKRHKGTHGCSTTGSTTASTSASTSDDGMSSFQFELRRSKRFDLEESMLL